MMPCLLTERKISIVLGAISVRMKREQKRSKETQKWNIYWITFNLLKTSKQSMAESYHY